ncbi:MAG TPA: CHAT domain-containing protein [Bradyrhizobium sp.]|nr:CHAT domain-containing protein [Bradyrhizobium sp.]
MVAEYRAARGLSRIKIAKSEFDGLVGEIRGLRSFIEGGAPEFGKEALRALGSRLFELLLVGRTRDLFFTATGEHEPGEVLPLEVVAEDPEVASWPWEYLYNSNAESFVAQEFHPISRSIFTSTKPSACGPIAGKVRMLLILGVPPDDRDTTPQEEIKYISEVFSAQLDDSRFEIDVLSAEEYQKIVTKLSAQEYHIVHYFGHAGFDYKERVGYLSIQRPGKERFKVDANVFALALRNRGVRLVFLNACKSAVSAPTENPARSSIAAALLDRGIPAVVASQFSIPDNSAHFLAATIYNALLTGRAVGDAIRDGRTAISFADAAKFFDWGIPVLYAANPGEVILPPGMRKPAWAEDFGRAAASGTLIETLAAADRGPPGAPSLIAERTRPMIKDTIKTGKPKYKVALVDIDAKVGFLPDLAQAANQEQGYYHFEVVYLPVPSGYAREGLGDGVQTYLPRLATVLGSTPDLLSVDFVCCLTRNMVATEDDDMIDCNLFAAPLPGNDRVIAVSTFGLRDYARQAGVSFAKAVLAICLSMLVKSDERWAIEYHDDTVGCLFDYCENRDDIVVGLRKMRFDHKSCRDKIKDIDQLAAIDALAELDVA